MTAKADAEGGNMHDEELAVQLRDRLHRHLAKAIDAVVPAGQLGAGMAVELAIADDSTVDPETGDLRLKATVILDVFRAHVETP